MTYHMARAARDWLNCRYVAASEGGRSDTKADQPNSTGDNSLLATQHALNSPQSDNTTTSEQQLRPEMVNYFKRPNILWFFIIPVALGFTFVSSCVLGSLIVSYRLSTTIQNGFQWSSWITLSISEILFTHWVSIFKYSRLKWPNSGTRYNWVIQLICIGALLAHIGEAVYALNLCDSLGFSHTCSLKWFVQTFILGFPSLTILLKYKRQKGKGGRRSN